MSIHLVRKVDGTGDIVLESVEGLYEYDKDSTKCGVCGGLGMPWRGWFHCEDGDHVAVIETGKCFKVVEYRNN